MRALEKNPTPHITGQGLRPRAHNLRMVFGVELLVGTNDISILAKTIEIDQLIIKSK